jgi:hypothetical protein
MANQLESSVALKNVTRPKTDQLKMPTYGLLAVLICALVILKTFIYIKDPKRHGK